MARPHKDPEIQAFIDDTWAALERLEHQRKLLELALTAARDPDVRARRRQTLARLEREIEHLDERLSAVQDW